MKRKTFKYPSAKVAAAALKEDAVLEPPPATLINVRAAKDQLSSLLEQADNGARSHRQRLPKIFLSVAGSKSDQVGVQLR